jgi:hypothetical protein
MELSENWPALLLLVAAAATWVVWRPGRKWAGPADKTADGPEPRLVPVPVTPPNRRSVNAASARRPGRLQ